MSGQQMFQVVSAGKTLRAKPPKEVVQEAAKAFSIPLSQARRLMVKGWVIKDRLSSKQVIEYRTHLQKIGLRVEVFPAGKFDNRALQAKMEFAQKRRARNSGEMPQVTASNPDAPRVAKPTPKLIPKPNPNPGPKKDSPPTEPSTAPATAVRVEKHSAGKARAQAEALFADRAAQLQDSPAERAQLGFGLLAAALVPGLFALLLGLCLYGAIRALWGIPVAVMAGDSAPVAVAGAVITLLMISFVAALLVWPFFSARRFYAAADRGARPLARKDAQGLYLIVEVLAEKLSLPKPIALTVSAGAEVRADAVGPGAIRAQEVPLNLGLGAVCALSGNEFAALVARALGLYRGKLRGFTAWLVLGAARNLQSMQWALENERTAVAPHGEPVSALKVPHAVLASCGRAAIPVVDRLYEFHRKLTAPVARRLERWGDACAAQILGSDEFVHFAEKWHQLVHAELVVAEINREAAIAGQRLADYPQAIRWMLQNLERETRSNIELAMAQASDSWDTAQAADNERIGWVEDLGLQALIERDFSVQKLIDDLPALRDSCSEAVAECDTRAVDNQRLLSASKEAENALQWLGEYFNQLPPRDLLLQDLPVSEDLAAMDLQAAIDWLRNKLVELRDLERRCDELIARGVKIQLGSALVKLQAKVQPQDFHLSGATSAAADENAKDNRARREEVQQQYLQIFSVFYLRVERAVAEMDSAGRDQARHRLGQLDSYRAMTPRLERLDRYGDMLSLMIDRLAMDASQRELVQKYYSLAAKELEICFATIDKSADLRRLGLAEALEDRIGRAVPIELPRERQGILDALQAMELRCKSASAAIVEHYRIQLAPLLESCIQREKSLGIRPLRLVGALQH